MATVANKLNPLEQEINEEQEQMKDKVNQIQEVLLKYKKWCRRGSQIQFLQMEDNL